jgi:hypothetical protein
MLRVIAHIVTTGELHFVVPGNPGPIPVRVRPGRLWVCIRGSNYSDVIITSDPTVSCQDPCRALLDGFPVSVCGGHGLACVVPGASGVFLTWEALGSPSEPGRVPKMLDDSSAVTWGGVHVNSNDTRLWDGSAVTNEEALQGFRGMTVWDTGFLMHWDAPNDDRRIWIYAPDGPNHEPGTLRLRWQ